MIRLGYFAATPDRPQLAFQFQLLDLLEALLLECQVAVKDVTSALTCLSRCPLQVLLVHNCHSKRCIHTCSIDEREERRELLQSVT